MTTSIRPAFVSLLLLASSAWAIPLPSADDLLKTVGYSPEEIATIKAGTIVRRETKGAGDRDLTLGYAFFVKATPAVLNKQLSAGVLQTIDPNAVATGTLTGQSSVDAFDKLSIKTETMKMYLAAKPGTALNLSSVELAGFDELPASASIRDVEAQVRISLLERYRAYLAKGLDGISDYDRGGDTVRSPQDELTAVMKTLPLQTFAPKAWASMLNYPADRLPGTREVFRWEQFKVKSVRTLALTHGMSVPNGDSFLIMQRQFYVSEGFNCEQAIVALLPVEGGTMVIFSSHTSTDKVGGFAGGIKRSIGRGIVAKQLEGLFGKLQTRAKRATK